MIFFFVRRVWDLGLVVRAVGSRTHVLGVMDVKSTRYYMSCSLNPLKGSIWVVHGE